VVQRYHQNELVEVNHYRTATTGTTAESVAYAKPADHLYGGVYRRKLSMPVDPATMGNQNAG
jgi:hypothetical protein